MLFSFYKRLKSFINFSRSIVTHDGFMLLLFFQNVSIFLIIFDFFEFLFLNFKFLFYLCFKDDSISIFLIIFLNFNICV